jgi:N-acetylmuramoyl-L-alanine amidase
VTSAPVAQPAAAVAQPVLPRTLPNFYRNLIVIDPAHGGPDHGAQLSGGAAEKDVVLAFAQKLRPALVAQGFTVASTRDSDPAEVLASEQRAGVANHARPLACLLLHTTESGSGIHIATSSLEPVEGAGSRVQRWNDAQAGSVAMSLRLANEIGLAMLNAKLPVVLLRASVPPADNMTCAAAVIEVSPLPGQDAGRAPVNDAKYQQKVAEAIAQGLASFRTHNAPAPTANSGTPPAQPASRPAAASSVPAAATATPAAKPVEGSKPVAPAPAKNATPPAGVVKPQSAPAKPESAPAQKKGAEQR